MQKLFNISFPNPQKVYSFRSDSDFKITFIILEYIEFECVFFSIVLQFIYIAFHSVLLHCIFCIRDKLFRAAY